MAEMSQRSVHTVDGARVKMEGARESLWSFVSNEAMSKSKEAQGIIKWFMLCMIAR